MRNLVTDRRNESNWLVLFQLHQPPIDADFDETTPCSPPPDYHVLHDPHLKEFFRNPTMRKRLFEKGD